MLTEHLIINLLLILTVAWGFGALFARFDLPVMLGDAPGLILGPPLLGIVQASTRLNFLVDLGIFFAMFCAGMEMKANNDKGQICVKCHKKTICPFFLHYL